jgi:hypothetical protein
MLLAIINSVNYVAPYTACVPYSLCTGGAVLLRLLLLACLLWAWGQRYTVHDGRQWCCTCLNDTIVCEMILQSD